MVTPVFRLSTALVAGLLVLGVLTAADGAENLATGAPPADMELRKSFRFIRHANRRVPASANGSGPASAEHRDARPASEGVRLETVAAALGVQVQSFGTLHLPGVGESGIVLQGARTPVLETAAGRHLIIDRDRTISPELAGEITRRWPAFSVVQPPPEANLHDLIGSVLAAAGYDTVLRSTPLVFGRGTTVRYTPDFIVLKSERDLLAGETEALSVLNPADALPDELRELAGDHRVHVVELSPAGAPLGFERAPWRDPTGRVTTVAASRALRIIEEIALAAGLSVEHHVPLQSVAGKPEVSADLRITRAGKAALLFENNPQDDRTSRERRGETSITLNADALPHAIGTLLRCLDLPAIGPTVEFYRATQPGAERRFVITVPGWLVETDGRRLLITGGELPSPVRLYLTREGIDILEYRMRAGR